MGPKFCASPDARPFRPHRSRRAARNSVAAKLKSAAGSYGSMPETPLLLNYLDQDGRRAFVDSMAEVKVKQGEVIARVGSSGNVDQPQLHFELRRGREAVDPERYLPRR